MKILIFCTYNQSFLFSFFKGLALKLSDRGWRVKIISIKGKPEIIEVNGQVSIEILKERGKWQNYISIYNLIKFEKPDVVISNFSYVNPAVLSCWFLGVKKNIVWFHTLTQQLNPQQRQIFFKSVFLRYASQIIVNSEYLKQDLENNYSVPNRKIFTIPFWSSLEANFITERIQGKDTFSIGCPGRIEEVKNQDIIIDALRNIEPKVNWRLFIAGGGSDEKRLKSHIEKHSLENKVEFLGVLDKKGMEQFYKTMDLIILPSTFEAFGLVLVEALSMGCPVLVSKNFGALTYIEDKEFFDKYSFDPYDVRALSGKIHQLLSGDVEPANYFREIYSTYFQKEKIIAKVENVLHQ